MRNMLFRTSLVISLASSALVSACGAEPGGLDPGADGTAADGVSSARSPIIGGSLIDVRTRRILGLVNVNGGCSGSLINPHWVMTATHCLDLANPNNDTFSIPRNDGSLATRRGVNLIPLGTSDITLIKLAPNLPSDEWPAVGNPIYMGTANSLVNKSITCYGQGAEDYDPDGTGVIGGGHWRLLTKTVKSTDGIVLYIEANGAGREITAYGDSGGVCLYNGQAVAVASEARVFCNNVDAPTCQATTTKIIGATLASVERFAGYIQNMPAMNDTLQVAGISSENNQRLMHAVRNPNGGWTGFGDVETQTGDIGVPIGTALKTDQDGRTHVVAINAAQDVFHTTRTPDGRWGWFRNLELESGAGDFGLVDRVAVAEVGEDMHVLAVNRSGHLGHTILNQQENSWQRFGDPETVAGEIGTVLDVSASGSGGLLHVCALNSDLRIFHAMRKEDGTWTQFGQMSTDQGTSPSCTVVNGTLHMLRVRQGVMEHRTRSPSGVWTIWRSVNASAGSSLSFSAVSSSEVGGDLHVIGNGSTTGHIHHTIRSTATSEWTAFGDINQATGFGIGFLDADGD